MSLLNLFTAALQVDFGIRPDESIRTGLAHPFNLLATTLSSAE